MIFDTMQTQVRGFILHPNPRGETLKEFVASSPLSLSLKERLNALIDDFMLHSEESLTFTPEIKALFDRYQADINLVELNKIVFYCRAAHLFENNGDPLEHAIKLAVVFKTAKAALEAVYLFSRQTKHGGGFERDGQFVHNACDFTLPEQRPTDRGVWDNWRKQFQENFTNASYRQLFPHVEVILQYYEPDEWVGDKEEHKEQVSSFLTSFFTRYKQALDVQAGGAKESDKSNLLRKLDELRNIWESADLNKELATLKKALPFIRTYIKQEKEGPREILVGAQKDLGQLLYFYACSLKHCKTLFSMLDKDAYSALHTIYFESRFLTEHLPDARDRDTYYRLDRSKAGENIPDVGHLKIPKHPEFYLRRLDVCANRHDAELAACLGQFTNCCQSIGKAGSKAAQHGLTSPDGGFYVLFQESKKGSDHIIAQSWAWRSLTEGLVLDSVEGHIPPCGYQVIIDFYELLADTLSNIHHLNEITVGSTNIEKMPAVGDNWFDSLQPLVRFIAQGLPKGDIGYRNDSRMQNVLVYSSRRTLLHMNQLSSEELFALIKKTIEEGIINKITMVEDLNDLLSACTSPEQKKVVYEAVKDRIGNSLPIKNGCDFSEILQHLDAPQRIEVYEALKDRIGHSIAIENGSHFSEILQHLDAPQRIEVYEALKDRLGSSIVIEDVKDFSQILRYLEAPQRAAFFETLKKYIGTTIPFKSALNFKAVLEYLEPSQRADVFVILKDCIGTTSLPVRGGDDFGQLLHHLDVPQIIVAGEILKKHMVYWNIYDFGRLLVSLDASQITAVCGVLKDCIGKNIPDLRVGFNIIICFLEEVSQITAFCKAVKDLIGSSIPIINGVDFRIALLGVNETKRTAVFEVFKDLLGNKISIRNSKDFIAVLRLLEAPQRHTTYEALKDILTVEFIESVMKALGKDSPICDELSKLLCRKVNTSPYLGSQTFFRTSSGAPASDNPGLDEEIKPSPSG